MVLWEITLGTAYFLGLKRTYKLALRLQRKIIPPKHPKIRQFAQRRTRAAFDVALRVHRSIQERDIEVGRNLGNWILRWLDRMKPSAQIRVKELPSSNAKPNITKQLNNSSQANDQGSLHRFTAGSRNDRESDRHLFKAASNIWSKPFPTITMMMRPIRPGSNIQHRPFSFSRRDDLMGYSGKFGFEGVIRNDIRQWIMR